MGNDFVKLRLGINPEHNLVLDGSVYLKEILCPKEFLDKLPSPNSLQRKFGLVDMENVVREILIPRIKNSTSRLAPMAVTVDKDEIHHITGLYRGKGVGIWLELRIKLGIGEIIKIKYDIHSVGVLE